MAGFGDVVALLKRKDDLWKKGYEIEGFDPAKWRYDIDYYVMYYAHYGRLDSPFGREGDYILPVPLGGVDHLDNMRPMQWRNRKRRLEALLEMAPDSC